MDKCPCGSGKSYAQCCEKYIKGTGTAPGPEALMRSRYSAYAKQEIDYIFSTQNPEHQQNLDRKETERWSKESEWLGLEIISSEESGDKGTVEFSARFKQDGKEHDHHEISNFQKIDGKWFFNDGYVPSTTVVREGPKVGRNEPCPCGSGKKYKKCCGLNS